MELQREALGNSILGKLDTFRSALGPGEGAQYQNPQRRIPDWLAHLRWRAGQPEQMRRHDYFPRNPVPAHPRANVV